MFGSKPCAGMKCLETRKDESGVNESLELIVEFVQSFVDYIESIDAVVAW